MKGNTDPSRPARDEAVLLYPKKAHRTAPANRVLLELFPRAGRPFRFPPLPGSGLPSDRISWPCGGGVRDPEAAVLSPSPDLRENPNTAAHRAFHPRLRALPCTAYPVCPSLPGSNCARGSKLRRRDRVRLVSKGSCHKGRLSEINHANAGPQVPAWHVPPETGSAARKPTLGCIAFAATLAPARLRGAAVAMLPPYLRAVRRSCLARRAFPHSPDRRADRRPRALPPANRAPAFERTPPEAGSLCHPRGANAATERTYCRLPRRALPGDTQRPIDTERAHPGE